MLRYQYNIGSLLNQLYVSGFLKPEKGAFAAKFRPFTARNLANRPERGIISPRRNVMRRNSGAIRMVFTGIFILTTVLFYAGCDVAVGQPQGVFENQTSYSITVTIVERFNILSSSDSASIPATEGSFKLDPGGKVIFEIFGSNAGLANFKWTTSSNENNSKIYVVNKRNKVTFKE
jgi:hypothetical protein